MKWLVLILCLCVTPEIVYAQTNVNVDLSDLPSDARDAVLAAQKRAVKKQDTVQSVSQWIGIGREVGEAMNAGLGAVVDQAERFGAGRVGSFTMFMIGWKIFGRDLLRVVVGGVLTFVGVSSILFVYWKCAIPRRVLIKHDKTTNIKEWKVVNDTTNDGMIVARITMVLGLILVLLIGGCNMLGGGV